jgi:hypothetical protein
VLKPWTNTTFKPNVFFTDDGPAEVLNDIEEVLETMGIKYEEHESKYKMNYCQLSEVSKEEQEAGA